MSNANEKQVAGDHYRSLNSNYQHWDLVADTGMGYFEGQITKYVARWRKKNGGQDLEKALHYAQKMQELILAGKYPVRQVPQNSDSMTQLASFASKQKLTREETIIFELCAMRVGEGDVERLIMHVESLLETAK